MVTISGRQYKAMSELAKYKKKISKDTNNLYRTVFFIDGKMYFTDSVAAFCIESDEIAKMPSIVYNVVLGEKAKVTDSIRFKLNGDLEVLDKNGKHLNDILGSPIHDLSKYSKNIEKIFNDTFNDSNEPTGNEYFDAHYVSIICNIFEEFGMSVKMTSRHKGNMPIMKFESCENKVGLKISAVLCGINM